MNLKPLICFGVFFTEGSLLLRGAEGFISSHGGRSNQRVTSHQSMLHVTPTQMYRGDEGKNSAHLHHDKQYTRGVLSYRREAILAIAGALSFPFVTNADEPSNIYYKSPADQEDPLAVFGKSLQNMSFDNTSSDTGEKVGSTSFSDITLPPSLPQATEEGGSDLSKAIEEGKLKQRRRVDPRTHG